MSSGSGTATADLAPAKLFSLAGHVGLVTGGGTGIGLMAAQALAAAGAKVYIAGRRREVLDNAAQHWSNPTSGGNGAGQLIPVTFDQTDKSSIEQLAKEIGSKEKFLSILVNNAGIAGETREVEKGDESAQALSTELLKDSFEEWTKIYQTNVIGYYFNAAAFLPLLAKATEHHKGYSGNIINITSISGITKTSQHHLHYNVSKAAANHLTSILAHELTRTSIRVNAIAPGIFPSEMTTSESDDKQKSHIDAKGYREDKNIPAGRPGRDEDMAQAIVMAATNQYLNGQIIAVDGGYLLSHP